jgi:putative flippase GtrA
MGPEPASEFETPTTVANFALQNPVLVAGSWIVLCLAAAGLVAGNMHWSLPFAYLAGIPLGTIVCWSLTFGFARGWIDGDD